MCYNRQEHTIISLRKGMAMSHNVNHSENNTTCSNANCKAARCGSAPCSPNLNEDHHHEHAAADYRVKQSKFAYGLVRTLSKFVSRFIFKKKLVRNEIKDKKGPFVIIANHEAALDFVNLIGVTKQPLTFVISNSFYSTLPFKSVTSRLGMIPKQQFQTSLKDIHKMKTAIDDGKILVIYPAGLMSDDGTPTPTPVATYGFLKWLKADVYVAKTVGTYFSMPKWRTDGLRAGKTLMDIYRLFDKDELAEKSAEEIQQITDEALYFDAYEDQEKLLVKYKRGNNIEGLENVLYICPHCGKEFTMKVRDKSVIYCEACGYEETCDEFGFLHNSCGFGEEIRHPSKWNQIIDDAVFEKIEKGELTSLESKVDVHLIPEGKSKFAKAGEAILKLTHDSFVLTGTINGKEEELTVSTNCFASLPYKPGKYIEVQNAETIYRCYPENGKMAAKFVDTVEAFYKKHSAECARVHECNKECAASGDRV